MDYKEKASKYIYGDLMRRDNEKSTYNHNYFNGVYGDLIYAQSDDDNTTEYYFVVDGNKHAIQFAYSLCTEGDKLIPYWQDNR